MIVILVCRSHSIFTPCLIPTSFSIDINMLYFVLPLIISDGECTCGSNGGEDKVSKRKGLSQSARQNK